MRRKNQSNKICVFFIFSYQRRQKRKEVQNIWSGVFPLEKQNYSLLMKTFLHFILAQYLQHCLLIGTLCIRIHVPFLCSFLLILHNTLEQYQLIFIQAQLVTLWDAMLGTVLPGFRNCDPLWLRLSKRTLRPEVTQETKLIFFVGAPPLTPFTSPWLAPGR